MCCGADVSKGPGPSFDDLEDDMDDDEVAHVIQRRGLQGKAAGMRPAASGGSINMLAYQYEGCSSGMPQSGSVIAVKQILHCCKCSVPLWHDCAQEHPQPLLPQLVRCQQVGLGCTKWL